MTYMPAELIEQILLKLPVKSLLRFSTASKLWNSIIFGPEFAQSYRGREMIVFESVRRYPANISRWAQLPLSSISSDNPADETTPFDFPPGSYLSSCDSLWCLKFEKSLLLYNPSIRTYRKLPNPPSLNRVGGYRKPIYVYGLGYDSACDDYKIVSMSDNYYSEIGTDMYSLRSDCWRRIEPHPLKLSDLSKQSFFVSGALHWLVKKEKLILSFHLSEEKFGLIELPELPALPNPVSGYQHLEMIVFGGKLRVFFCYDDSHISVWVMEDYESKVWMKEMEFDYGHMFSIRKSSTLRPFYFYDGVGNLVRALALSNKRENMFIYKQEKGSPSTPTFVEKNFGSDVLRLVRSFTYVESLICFPKADDESMAVDDESMDVDDESMAAALGIRWRIDK